VLYNQSLRGAGHYVYVATSLVNKDEYYSAADRAAEYCDERVCLSVCVFVCPIFTKFLCMLPMVVARSLSGGVMIRYVLPLSE